MNFTNQKTSFLIIYFMLFNMAFSIFVIGEEKPKSKIEKISEKLKKRQYWYLKDYRDRDEDYKRLVYLSKEYGEKKLQEAKKYYEEAKAIIVKMEDKIKAWNKEFEDKIPQFKNPWQKEEGRRNLFIRIKYYKQDKKGEAVGHLYRGIIALDKVRNKEIRNSKDFLGVLIKIYKMYLSLQYDLGNSYQALPIAESLKEMYEKNPSIFTKEDAVWLYRYLGNLYSYVEHFYSNSFYAKNRREKIREYRINKLRAFMKATELVEGKDSDRYKELEDELRVVEAPVTLSFFSKGAKKVQEKEKTADVKGKE